MQQTTVSPEIESRVNVAALADRWWTLALRGVAALAFGIAAIVVPDIGLLALVLLFGAFAIVDGSFNLVHATHGARPGRRWGVLVLEGTASIVAGLLTFLWPGITAIVLVLIIAAWAFVTGIFEVIAAVRLRKQIRYEWLLALSGVLAMALGVLMFLFPGAGALTVVIWVGAYAIVSGLLLLALAFRLRKWRKPPERPVPHGGVPAPAS
jgi:uncharacterized membrane protein HdeD (DUF308 family)